MFIQIEYLDKNEVMKAICQDFWQIDEYNNFVYSANEVANRYNINVNALYKITKASCVVHLPNAICPICQIPHGFHTRTDFHRLLKKTDRICGDCIEKQQREKKRKQEEILQKKLQERAKQEQIQRRILLNDVTENIAHNPFNLETASIRQLIILLSFIRFAANEDLTCIQPYSAIKGVILAPNTEYSINLISELYHQNVILISPDSDLSSIAKWQDYSYELFDVTKVEWVINHKEPISYIKSYIEKKFMT